MSIMLNTAAVAAATLMMLTSASARDRGDRRQAHQDERIYAGYATGDLTGREATRLVKQQNRIEGYEDHLTDDGDYTKRDKVKMEIVQDAASADIYRLRHNNRERN
jgi:hypothetical protein